MRLDPLWTAACIDRFQGHKFASADCWELLQSGGLPVDFAVDHLAREIAVRFLDDSLEWESACSVINTLYFLLLELNLAQAMPDKAWKIFEAFDAGEVKGPEFTIELLAEAGIHKASPP